MISPRPVVEHPARLQAARARPSSAAPRVSVIVPCFNYGHYLEACVRSVLEQEGVDVRLLVIDDRSTDDSAQVAARVCASDPRVEVLAHEKNGGLIATANEGLAWADGDYVVLLSADDLVVPGALHRAVSIMEAHPDVGLVYGRPLLLREGQPPPKYSGRWRSTRLWPGEDWIRTRCKATHNAMSSPEVVVRNRVQRLVGGYDPTCFHASDLNMWLRIAAVSNVAYVSGVPQAIYRIHAKSMQRSQEGPLVDLRERGLAFESFFASSGARLRDRDQLATFARRQLARDALWRASRTVDRGGEGADPLVEELVKFALEVYPEARHLRQWRGLRARQWMGAGRSRVFPLFVATGVLHRLSYHARRTRWRTHGV